LRNWCAPAPGRSHGRSPSRAGRSTDPARPRRPGPREILSRHPEKCLVGPDIHSEDVRTNRPALARPEPMEPQRAIVAGGWP
jgi:hypothetical protein